MVSISLHSDIVVNELDSNHFCFFVWNEKMVSKRRGSVGGDDSSKIHLCCPNMKIGCLVLISMEIIVLFSLLIASGLCLEFKPKKLTGIIYGHIDWRLFRRDIGLVYVFLVTIFTYLLFTTSVLIIGIVQVFETYPTPSNQTCNFSNEVSCFLFFLFQRKLILIQFFMFARTLLFVVLGIIFLTLQFGGFEEVGQKVWIGYALITLLNVGYLFIVKALVTYMSDESILKADSNVIRSDIHKRLSFFNYGNTKY